MTTQELTLSPAHTDRIASAIADAVPDTTRRAYNTGWRAFEDFCSTHGYQALPASSETVAAFITDLDARGFSPSTIAVYHAAVMNRHGQAAEELRTFGLKQTMRGIHRRQRGYQPVKARALNADEVLAMSQVCGDDKAGRRDRWVLLVGVSLGLRYSDLAAVRLSDVEKVPGKGYAITIPWSKTSDEGVTLALPTLAPELADLDATVATDRLLEVLPTDGGMMMRGVQKGGRRWRDGVMSANGLREVIRNRAQEAGVDTDRLSNHSLRATYATGAYDAEVPEEKIAITGRWSSLSVQRGYNRASMWVQPAAGWLEKAFRSA